MSRGINPAYPPPGEDATLDWMRSMGLPDPGTPEVEEWVAEHIVGEDVTDDDPWEARHASEPEPSYPETYHCGYCSTVFWDGNRKGHLFNGEEIECPYADEWEQDEED